VQEFGDRRAFVSVHIANCVYDASGRKCFDHGFEPLAPDFVSNSSRNNPDVSVAVLDQFCGGHLPDTPVIDAKGRCIEPSRA
jgi:hypothetical protein